MKNILIVISLFVVVSLLVIFLPGNNSEFIRSGKLYISEIVASNNSIKDNMDETSDYIEIYNGYDYDINLEGYYISDSEFDVKKWMFPKLNFLSV